MCMRVKSLPATISTSVFEVIIYTHMAFNINIIAASRPIWDNSPNDSEVITGAGGGHIYSSVSDTSISSSHCWLLSLRGKEHEPRGQRDNYRATARSEGTWQKEGTWVRPLLHGPVICGPVAITSERGGPRVQRDDLMLQITAQVFIIGLVIRNPLRGAEG